MVPDWRAALLAGAAALALSACAAIPDLGSAPEPKPSSTYAVRQSFGAPAIEWPSDHWWTAYGDSQLDQLIEEALAGAPDLAKAQARVRRAEALAEMADSTLGPHLDAVASVAEAKQSYNNGIPSALVPHGWRDIGLVGAGLDWQIDFFGKNHALLAAATSDADAARAEEAEARLTLSTAVAAAYASFARLYADRDAAEEALRVRADSEHLISQRCGRGLETQAALERAHAGRADAEAELAATDEAIGLSRNGIAALLGQGPDRGLRITRPAPGAIHAFGLPASLQADLVGRRPDVTAARLSAEAAASRIKVAKAEFYPNVNLTAFIGVQSLGLNVLTRAGSSMGSVGPAITLPIFESGRLQGNYRGARAEYDEAVAGYDETLTKALQDVADSAVSARALNARL
ncbi:MAG: efflux transporter outer membrane subunit, partial [Caulobacteraceae bacterium]|nr:efflux transporter outer membrane subunit [Caulobacteraceae bacterium]